ncbi:unnamed protein product [Sphacelaria rigidula]
MDDRSSSGEGIGAALAGGWQALVQWTADPFEACSMHERGEGRAEGQSCCYRWRAGGDAGDYSPPRTSRRTRKGRRCPRQSEADDISWVAYTWLNTPDRRHQLGERANQPPPRLYTPPSSYREKKRASLPAPPGATPPVTPPHSIDDGCVSTKRTDLEHDTGGEQVNNDGSNYHRHHRRHYHRHCQRQHKSNVNVDSNDKKNNDGDSSSSSSGSSTIISSDDETLHPQQPLMLASEEQNTASRGSSSVSTQETPDNANGQKGAVEAAATAAAAAAAPLAPVATNREAPRWIWMAEDPVVVQWKMVLAEIRASS